MACAISCGRSFLSLAFCSRPAAWKKSVKTSLGLICMTRILYWRNSARQHSVIPVNANLLAAALVQSGRFHVALKMLGPQTIDAFAQTLADWSDYFETVKPGLFLQILREVTDVSGWVYPNWRKRHESLCSCDLNPFQRLEGCDGI